MNDFDRTSDVEQAARDVEQRKLDLSRSIQQVEKSGERMARRLSHELKPVLIGAAVVAGAALLVGVAALLARRRPRERWLAPARPSAAGAVARTLGLALLRLAGQQVARALAERVARAPLEPGQPAPAQ